MKFRTEIPPSIADFTLNHERSCLFIGSCFSDTFGSLFLENWFNAISNPFGTVYNSTSILNQLHVISKNLTFKSNQLEKEGTKYFHYDFHSRFSGRNPDLLTSEIGNIVTESHTFFKKCDVFFITLGSAFVYKLRKSDQIVANCHKLPSENFTKYLMSTEEILADLLKISDLITSNLPEAKIVLTVSPVRHIKDGIVDNNRSKAHLISAVHKAVEQEPLSYFPSYELLLDDLRDYRFYGKDLIHPSEGAVEYIWQYFKQTYFDPETQHLIDKITKLNASLSHRPMDQTDPAYLSHLTKTKEEVLKLASAFPGLKPPLF